MSDRVPVAPNVLSWALQRSGHSLTDARKRFGKIDDWLNSDPSDAPTPKQLQQLSTFTGIPFGFLLLPNPPQLGLPVADFREGHTGDHSAPSANLLAVLNQSIRRQEWYRDYAVEHDLAPVEVVGRGRDESSDVVAADMRTRLGFEVDQRTGTWQESRRHLIGAFEALGGLTVTTSVVENNTRRPLDDDEFRGFSLVDPRAPLVFVNATQTLNGQLFTLAHEFAHVWRGVSGISSEDVKRPAENDVEAWCNAVASEFLVPQADLRRRFASIVDLGSLAQQLDRLASIYRCGTLVVLQSIRRGGLIRFSDFDTVYADELRRLRGLAEERSGSGGDHYRNQPYRVGGRLSRAIISDAIEGRTSFTEAMSLMSMRSLKTFDKYAEHLGVGA